MIGLIWAEAAGRVIGSGGDMPWHLPEDLAHFKRTTGNDAVIMGRNTWESFPEGFRPLPGRRNIVITRGGTPSGAERAGSLDEAVRLVDADAWVIGGAHVYAEALPVADRVVVTEIDLEVDGDTFAPELGSGWRAVSVDPASGWHTSRTGTRYRIVDYARS